jgi:putative ABC transport system substrate-binding protein
MKRAAMPSILVVVVLLAVAVIAEAQQPKKVFRIGYLTSSEPVGDFARAEAFRQILRGLGYIEGQNIITEYRYAAGKPDRLSGLAAELVSLKVDVIVVAGGSGPIRAAKNATKTIPIVMMGPGLDPVEAGFVESLAHPGGNITGFTDLSGHLGGKRLELLKDVVPKVARVAVLYEANNPRNTFEFKEVLPVSARALGLTMQPQEVRDENDLTRVFAVINKDRPDGLLVLGGPIMNLNYKRTANFVLKSRLPSVYDRREAVDAGGLIFYGADLADSYRRIAYYVDRILKGAKPADLPVEQPTKFEFVINLKTAKQIGVTIPPEVLARANRLIK